MAKVPFSKFQASVNNNICQKSYCNKSGEDIYYEVKYYLPLGEKLELVTRIINNSIDDNGFYNPMRVKLYMTLEVVYAYTNLSFTEKMKEDPFKLYDILVSTGIFEDVVSVIRESDWKEIEENVWMTIENLYKYKNSIMGILDAVSNDYSDLNFNLNEIQDKISNPEQLTFLKEILPLTNTAMV